MGPSFIFCAIVKLEVNVPVWMLDLDLAEHLIEFPAITCNFISDVRRSTWNLDYFKTTILSKTLWVDHIIMSIIRVASTWLSSTICRELSSGLRAMLVGQWSSTDSAWKYIINHYPHIISIFSYKVRSGWNGSDRVFKRFLPELHGISDVYSTTRLWSILCSFMSYFITRLNYCWLTR